MLNPPETQLALSQQIPPDLWSTETLNSLCLFACKLPIKKDLWAKPRSSTAVSCLLFAMAETQHERVWGFKAATSLDVI